jgi:hypothetical protein
MRRRTVVLPLQLAARSVPCNGNADDRRRRFRVKMCTPARNALAEGSAHATQAAQSTVHRRKSSFGQRDGRGPGRDPRTGRDALQIDRSRRNLRRILVGCSEASTHAARDAGIERMPADVTSGAEQPLPSTITLLPPDHDSHASPTAADTCHLEAWSW